jgi:hypothetical protein
MMSSCPDLLPRVTLVTRDREEIDEKGTEIFTMECIRDIEETNPELLQMVHNFTSRHIDCLGVMEGFVLLYRALAIQSSADRAHLQ